MSDLETDLEMSPRSNLMAYLESPCMISYLCLILSFEPVKKIGVSLCIGSNIHMAKHNPSAVREGLIRGKMNINNIMLLPKITK
jgi:hypothetical protein